MPRYLPLWPRVVQRRVVPPRLVVPRVVAAPRLVVPRLAVPRLVVPRATAAQNLVSLPRHAWAGVRVYRRTPPRLRRVEPAMRVAVSAVALWFSALFVALSILVSRVAGASSPSLSSAPSSVVVIRGGPWLSLGYFVAALLGPVGAALFLTRRHRCGLAALAAMFVVAQVLTLIAVL